MMNCALNFVSHRHMQDKNGLSLLDAKGNDKGKAVQCKFFSIDKRN